MRAKFITILNSEWLCWALLLVALAPIYCSAIKYQGWGGDYAGYLLEARAIGEGNSLASTNYMYNPNYAELAPPAYPVGFPLLLAPIFKIFGYDVLAFTRFMAILWWLLGGLIFLFLKSRFSNLVSLGAAIFFVFQPLLFFERNAVLSDIPFTIFTLLTVYYYTAKNTNNSTKNAILVGFLAGFAWQIRLVGFIIPVVIVCHILTEQLFFQPDRKSRFKKGWWRYPVIVLGIALGIQLLFHGILFRLPDTGSYMDQVSAQNLFAIFKENIAAYTKAFIAFFQLNGDLWYIYRYKTEDAAVQLGGAIAMAFLIMGLLNVKNSSERFFIGLVVAYLTVIMLWPSYQGLRFILPVLPILLYFLLKAIEHQNMGSKLGNQLKWLIIPLLLYGEYYRLDQHIYTYTQIFDVGAPDSEANQDAYHFVRDSITEPVNFGYHHPLIFSLHTNKPVMRWRKQGSPAEIQADFEKFNVQYILVNNWLAAVDEPLKNYLEENVNHLDTVWHNEMNVLYKFK